MKGLAPDPKTRVSVDALSDVVESMRFKALFVRMVRVNPPWGFFVPSQEMCVLHAVTRGHHYWTVEGGPTLELHPGDVVVVPRGDARWVQDVPGTPLKSVEDMRRESNVLPPSGTCRDEFIGIGWQITAPRGNSLLNFLPKVVSCRGSAPGTARSLRLTIGLLRQEYLMRTPGRAAVLIRLAETALVHAIRIWIEQLPENARGWVRALKDDQIAAALQAIHQDPVSRWTVESLAAQAGMSRSAIAERFNLLVGEPPMEYVRRWRLQHAADLLHDPRVSVKRVIATAGYSSEAAFRSAFRKSFGTVPSDYRKERMTG
jgi:AraC-like DNA-binding protein